MAHKLPPLKYDYNALEPYIDEETMRIHHTKHHQAYVDKLNAALEIDEGLMDLDPVELIKDLDAVPEKIRMAVRNHGGGHVNHSFLWEIMKKGTKPHGEILKAIEKRFTNIDKFKEELKNAALTRFGSGWAWLGLNNEKLEIISTLNQDSPLMEGKTPILGIDVWEHAYYLKHKSNRAAYVDDFFNVINWDKINEHYKIALR